MAASWRTMWQKWKKDNPGFEALRVKTIDLGPLMDDIQHEIAAFERDMSNLNKNFRELEAIKRKLEQGLAQYNQDYHDAVARQFPYLPGGMAAETERVKAERVKFTQNFDRKYREFVKLINDRGLWKDTGDIPRLGQITL